MLIEAPFRSTFNPRRGRHGPCNCASDFVRIGVLLTAAWAAAAPSSAVAQSFTSIDVPGASETRAHAINDRGEIVGFTGLAVASRSTAIYVRPTETSTHWITLAPRRPVPRLSTLPVTWSANTQTSTSQSVRTPNALSPSPTLPPCPPPRATIAPPAAPVKRLREGERGAMTFDGAQQGGELASVANSIPG